MSNKRMLRVFGQIDDKYVSDYLYDSQKSERTVIRKLKANRFTLIAALVALMLFLMGCAWIVLHMQDLKIGTETITQAQNSGIETEVQLDVLSLQDIQGTANYQANEEWLAFTQSYESTGGEYWESDPAYWAYSVQNQEMVDKLDEICSKYGLKIIGKPWHEQIDCNQFLPLLGVDSLLRPNAEASLSIPSGRYFPSGFFTIYGTLNLGDTSEMFTFQCIKKDVFYDVFGYVNPDTVSQRNYTTKSGVDLLFLESEKNGMILANREDCFLSLDITLTGSTTLEQIAECFDFTIQPKAPDTAAADAREQASIEEMNSRQDDPNRFRRATYTEYVEDLIQSDEMLHTFNPEYTPPVKTYAFYDVDGNGTDELLIFYDGYIGSIVGMKDGKTDDGKSYHVVLCEDHVVVDEGEFGHRGTAYHIFRFANNGDPVFSNPKEQSIVRLLKGNDGTWWRTSSTDHYAEFDTQISEAEAMEILNTYRKPIQLDTHPLSEFKES